MLLKLMPPFIFLNVVTRKVKITFTVLMFLLVDTNLELGLSNI